MRAQWLILIVFVVVLGLFAWFDPRRQADAPAPETKSAGKDGEIGLTEGGYADFDGLVRQSKGSVVAVDFWATWCGPCRQRFPHLVALSNKYSDLGLVCISVSLDEPEDKESVLRFLKKNGASFSNFLWSKKAPGDGQEFVGRYRYGGGIPHMVLFGRSGGLVWNSTTNPLAPAAVDQLVRELLDQKP